jgi:uncharacterized repeat protein (TIGR01451 family)
MKLFSMGKAEMKNTHFTRISGLKGLGISSLALLTAVGAVTPTYSAIDNSAVAVGTFNAADDTTSAPDTASVPVLQNRDLSIAKSVFTAPSTALGGDAANTDAGDEIVYRYTITNNGSVTENNVAPNDPGPTFNGANGAGSLSAFTEVTGAGAGTGDAATLAPGETVVFEATYTLAQLDVLNAAGVTDGVSNVATATSDDIPNSPPSPPALTEIPAVPALDIVKVAVLNDEINADNLAEAGETITYTYTVTNSGNVALTNVGIQDTHEGTLLTGANLPAGEAITTEGPLGPSDIGVSDDGVIDTLEAGATATFTVTLTVTQDEVDDG